ncbi:MAG: sulfotransferase domain-containing protein [Chitinophagales bacterium]
MITWLQSVFGNKLPTKRILLYGLQRSGTNYLETLIQLNYPSCKFVNGPNRNEIIHKHYRLYDNKICIPEPQFYNNEHYQQFADFEKKLPFDAPDVYLVMSKDPYSWYTSYIGWSKKNNWPQPPYHYIEEYNLFYGKWMAFAEENKRIIFIQYAEALTNPERVLQKIAHALNLPVREKIKTTKKVYASRRFTSDKKDAFLHKSYLQKISPEDFVTINTLLDKGLLSKLGYQIESTQ